MCEPACHGDNFITELAPNNTIPILQSEESLYTYQYYSGGVNSTVHTESFTHNVAILI